MKRESVVMQVGAGAGRFFHRAHLGWGGRAAREVVSDGLPGGQSFRA